MDEFEKLGKWLGTTNQQFDLLKTINGLELRGERCNPKGISVQYYKDYSKRIQISNLFHVLEALMDKGLIKKASPASYILDVRGIDRVMDSREEILEGELEAFRKAKIDTEKILDSMSKKEEPTIEYLDEKNFFLRIAESASRAKKHYMMAHFPKMLYPEIARNKLNRREYLDMIRNRSLVEGKLEVNILTDFDLDFVRGDFETFFNQTREKKQYAASILDEAENIMKNHNMFRIYYTKKILGMDMVLPVRDNPHELYLYMRGGKDIIGGIRIESREAAEKALESFMQVPDDYVPLKGIGGERILNGLRRNIRKLW